MSFGSEGSPSICYLIKLAGYILISLILSLSSALGAVIHMRDILLGRCACDSFCGSCKRSRPNELFFSLCKVISRSLASLSLFQPQA